MDIKFNGYLDKQPRTISLTNNAVIKRDNFDMTIRLSTNTMPYIGEEGTTTGGKFIVKSTKYINPNVAEIGITFYPSQDAINKVKVIGQSKDMPQQTYTRNFILPDVKTYEHRQTLQGIPGDWFTDHLNIHSQWDYSSLKSLVSVRKGYVDAVKELVRMVLNGDKGVMGQLVVINTAFQKVIGVGHTTSPGLMGYGEAWSTSFKGPQTGYTIPINANVLSDVTDISQFASDIATVYTTPIGTPGADASVAGSDFKVTEVYVQLDDFEIMSGKATIQIGTHTIDLDLSKLSIDDTPNSSYNWLCIQLLAKFDFNPEGATRIFVNYRLENHKPTSYDKTFMNNLPQVAALTIPSQEVKAGRQVFAEAILASLKAPFSNMSTTEIAMNVVKTALSDAYHFDGGKGDADAVVAMIASVVAVVATFAVNPIAGAGLGAILIASAFESNIPITRVAELNKVAGNVLESYGIPMSQDVTEGIAPRQENGAINVPAASIDLYTNQYVVVSPSVPTLITMEPVGNDYAKWSKRPRELRQPITRTNVSDYPTPFNYWGVEAITTTPDANVKQALGYLNTGEI